MRVICETCEASKGVNAAFGEHSESVLPKCRGRHPQSKEFEDCDLKVRAMVLGAANLWFPLRRTALSIPPPDDPVAELVTEHWPQLRGLPRPDVLATRAKEGAEWDESWAWISRAGLDVDELWEEIQNQKDPQDSDADPVDLLAPEWEALSSAHITETADFALTPVAPPDSVHVTKLAPTRLVTRLREVTALTGFTRVDSLDPDDEGTSGAVRRGPIHRLDGDPRFVPAAESRGEGIFVQLDEDHVAAWEKEVEDHDRLAKLVTAHMDWRRRRGLPPDSAVPHDRFVLLHTLSHLIINELALEAGYSSASIRERLYARPPQSRNGPMAGILLYTAEPDSEGTLGGLVSLGNPEPLGRVIDSALRRAQLCPTDPFCAEHEPEDRDGSLHGAACHTCLFLPETSCQASNRYLDRAVAVPTLTTSDDSDLAFFPWTP